MNTGPIDQAFCTPWVVALGRSTAGREGYDLSGIRVVHLRVNRYPSRMEEFDVIKLPLSGSYLGKMVPYQEMQCWPFAGILGTWQCCLDKHTPNFGPMHSPCVRQHGYSVCGPIVQEQGNEGQRPADNHVMMHCAQLSSSSSISGRH